MEKLKLLFVCSRNQKRSLTAERVFARSETLDVRSAGTEPSARVRVNRGHVDWADVIFVMEKRHRERLLQAVSELGVKKVIVLGIPDEYELMDPELVEMLQSAVNELDM